MVGAFIIKHPDSRDSGARARGSGEACRAEDSPPARCQDGQTLREDTVHTHHHGACCLLCKGHSGSTGTRGQENQVWNRSHRLHARWGDFRKQASCMSTAAMHSPHTSSGCDTTCPCERCVVLPSRGRDCPPLGLPLLCRALVRLLCFSLHGAPPAPPLSQPCQSVWYSLPIESHTSCCLVPWMWHAESTSSTSLPFSACVGPGGLVDSQRVERKLSYFTPQWTQPLAHRARAAAGHGVISPACAHSKPQF